MDATGIETAIQAKPIPARHRMVKLIFGSVAIACSALAFPSVLPWMIAFWLVCHTALIWQNRPGWVPLLICLLILVAKLVPRTPAMLVFICLAALLCFFLFRRRHHRGMGTKRWAIPALLWVSSVAVAIEWRQIEQRNQPTPLDLERPIVCVGDSLTDGMRPDLGYPEQLKKLVRVPVVNQGMSGITTRQALGQMERVLASNPQVVVIELGGHDFLKGHGRHATKENLIELIDQCRDSGAEVVLMEIPRGFIFDPYASLEREIAYEKDVQLVPDTWLRQIVIMGPAFPLGIWFPDWKLSDDGIHSNQRGSRAIAQKVADALQQMYGKKVLTVP